MSVDAGEDTIVSYEYNDYNGKLKKLTYASGFVVEYVYNDLELLKEIWYTNNGVSELAYEYEYTDKGQVHEFIDNLSGKSTVYKYDTFGKLMSFAEYGNDDSYLDLSAFMEYNDSEWLDNIRYYLNHQTTSASAYNWAYSYKYCTDGLIEYVNLDTADADGTESYYYDGYNRVTEKLYSYSAADSDSEFRNYVEYVYEASGDYTSNRVEIHKSTVNDGDALTSTFTYDANGNITKIVYSTGEEVRYVYDYLNRLIREDNGLKDYTYVYTYDKSGNILTKVSYALTAAGTTPSNPRSTNTYTYATDGWGDRLTAYNGTAITYDDMGNPVSYSNGAGSYTFTWSGRQATTIQKGPLTYYLTYNDEGMRTSKTVNGVTTTYYVSGTQILAEETNGNVTVYLYDSEGAPLGMQYHGASYAADDWDVFWYERNIFGDVIAVYDEAGILLISYTYDAYGQMGSMSHNNGYSTQAYYNPFRYRGYYYDRDLSLYYLSTRYYDCRTGRFVSPDNMGYLGANGDLNSYNLYAYCSNNPSNYKQRPISSVGSIADSMSSGTIGGGFLHIASVSGGNLGVFNQTIKGSFRNGFWFGNGSITGFYADWNARTQISLRKGTIKVGIAGKFSVLNASGQIGFGTDDLNLSLKVVGDALTASGMTGIFIDPKKGTYFIGAEAKATALSGRVGGQLDIFGLQIEVGLSGELGSIGGRLGVGVRPTNDGKMQFYYGSGLALGVGWDFYIRIRFDELF